MHGFLCLRRNSISRNIFDRLSSGISHENAFWRENVALAAINVETVVSAIFIIVDGGWSELWKVCVINLKENVPKNLKRGSRRPATCYKRKFWNFSSTVMRRKLKLILQMLYFRWQSKMRKIMQPQLRLVWK